VHPDMLFCEVQCCPPLVKEGNYFGLFGQARQGQWNLAILDLSASALCQAFNPVNRRRVVLPLLLLLQG
jgi:hypothetical protein